jgi:uncharacterized RDD family membrane protein YckC
MIKFHFPSLFFILFLANGYFADVVLQKLISFVFMSNITVGTPFNIDLEFVTAPVSRRIGAVLLDMFILLLYMLLVYRFIIVSFDIGSKMNQLIMMTGISILPFLYFPVTEILMNGQTPGKRILGIKVIDISGNEPSLSQYLLRWLVGFGNYSVFLLPYVITNGSMQLMLTLVTFIFILGIFYSPDFLSCIISSKHQRLADIAAGTVVIDLRKKMDFSETIFLEVETQKNEAVYPEVMQLSDKDINGIRNLLSKKSKSRDDWEYRAAIVQKICKALKIDSKGKDDTEFLEQLLKDYNYLTQRK